MKNLSPRQQKILNLVTQKGDLAVEEIQRAINVSQATAYREIQALAQMGLAAKIAGGIGRMQIPLTRCIQCGHENNPRLTFLIEKQDGTKSAACCPHCGLMALESLDGISTAMTADFFHGTMLNARQAWYVLNSNINLCCSPSVLSFLQRDYAERFSKGFGGDVVNFASAQTKIKEMMAL